MHASDGAGSPQTQAVLHCTNLRMRSAWSHGLNMSRLAGGPCWSAGASAAGASLRLPNVPKAAEILSTALIASSVAGRVYDLTNCVDGLICHYTHHYLGL
jgi:hypothetical protein